jgi:UDP-N-acetylmuramoyl-tripeptide--D-alanyl-D-alanine ligase
MSGGHWMMSLARASQVLSGTLQGEDSTFTSVSTDTRSLKPGALYFALTGENFDGHNFIEKAQQAGAVAAVVSAANADNFSLPRIQVSDTRKALGRLAAAWRQDFRGAVIGVTGSNGKTTVKEMIAAILAKQGDVLATQGNFNNDIGLPLTLLSMDLTEKFAVIEMGANHHGEIAGLTKITRPDVAIITNAGPAHLEGFGSIKGVAEAKGEIYSGLTEKGIAIINADDVYADNWLSLCEGRKIIRFALDNDAAEVKGEWKATGSGSLLNIRAANQQCDIKLLLAGRHNAMNALAAAAAAMAVGISLEDVKNALSEFEPVKGRLNICRTDAGMCVIDDTYNANPASLDAGLNVLNDLPGEHWLVLGDMGELGDNTERLHFDVGVKASTSGVNRLLAIGENSISAVKAFGNEAMHFKTHDELIGYLKTNMHSGLNILIKGSRYMKMEQVVEALIGDKSSCC